MPKFGAAINTQRIPILGLRPQQAIAASPPAASSPADDGLFWHDTTNGVIKVFLGSSWKTLGEAGAGGPPSGAVPAGGDLSGSYPAPTIGTGKVTTNHILDGTIALADLSATGTKDATTFLRGDNTWSVVAQTGDNGKKWVDAVSTVSISGGGAPSGTASVDGVSIGSGQRILLTAQTQGQYNGIWDVIGPTWTRATDADIATELYGAYVFVLAGTVNHDTGWLCTNEGALTVGTTPLVWEQFTFPRAPAGGDLQGTYPNPDIAPGVVDLTTIASALKPTSDGGSAAQSSLALRRLGLLTDQAMPGATNLNLINAPTGDLSLNSKKIINLLDPASAQDAATKAYVDSVAVGLSTKTSVRAASDGQNYALSGSGGLYNPPDGFSGIMPGVGDRFLVKDQVVPAQNGIYIVAAGGWTRAPDLDTWAEVPGAFAFVEEGNLRDTGWVCTADRGGTIGSTAMPWTQFTGAGSFTDGAGLSKSGNILNVNVDNATIEIPVDTLQVKAGGITATQLSASSVNSSKILDDTILIADLNTTLKDGTAGSKQIRAIGTGAGDVVAGNDTRLTDARTPVAHQHPASDVNSGNLDVARLGTSPAVTTFLKAAGASGAAAWASVATVKTDLALNNVDNTSDANKPLSTAETTALANKANLTHSHAIGDLPVAPSGTSSSTQLVRADDSRLSDQRVPTDNSVSAAKLQANSVDSTKIVDGSILSADLDRSLVQNGFALGNATAGTAAIRALGFGTDYAMPGNARLDQLAAPIADVSLNARKIFNLLDPVNAQDAATKNYVDTVAQGLDAKPSVKIAIATNNSLISVASLDGVTIGSGDRILFMGQTNPAENGIWVHTSGGSPMARATDLDNWSEVPGAFVFVEQGTYADTGWVSTANSPGTIGTTAMPWVQFSSAGSVTAGTGMTQSGQTLNVIGTAGRIVANADNVDIDSGYVGQASITTVGTLGAGAIGGSFAPVPIANGGTGGNTALLARSNLVTSTALQETLPALAAGVWTNLPGAGYSNGVIAQFFDAASPFEEVHLDLRRDPGTANALQVRADLAYSAGALVGQYSFKAV